MCVLFSQRIRARQKARGVPFSGLYILLGSLSSRSGHPDGENAGKADEIKVKERQRMGQADQEQIQTDIYMEVVLF
jgi:hypothetical protein